LGPVRHRSAQAQIHLTVIRARAEISECTNRLGELRREGWRSLMVNGCAKCGTQQVSRELATELSAELREVLEPLLKEVESLNERIKEYDARMEKIARESYPQVALLKQVKGWNTDCADVCPDPGRSAAIPKESRGRLFSRVASWAPDSGEKPSARCTSVKKETLI